MIGIYSEMTMLWGSTIGYIRKMLSTECRMPNVKHQVPSADYRVPIVKCRSLTTDIVKLTNRINLLMKHKIVIKRNCLHSIGRAVFK